MSGPTGGRRAACPTRRSLDVMTAAAPGPGRRVDKGNGAPRRRPDCRAPCVGLETGPAMRRFDLRRPVRSVTESGWLYHPST